MKSFTPHISLFLALIILISTFSCADDSDNTNQTDTQTTTALTTSEAATEELTETETELNDNVPELDFDGADFRIFTGRYATCLVDTFSREEDGDLLNDVLARRNSKIEERLGINFVETVSGSIFDTENVLNKIVRTDEDSYELMMQIDRYALASGLEGELHSYSDLPYVDLSMPWWNQNIAKDLSVNNKLFFSYGDDNLVFFGATTILAFNKELISAHKLDNPYQLVYDGKWTYEKFMEMNRAVVDDLNGDGNMTVEDQWGSVIVSNSFFTNFWLQDGYKLVEKDDNDLPYFNVPGNDGLISRMIELAEDSTKGYWYNIANETDWKTNYNMDHDNAVMAIFSQGKSLFVSSTILTIMDVRGMETDFGILPYPASDEKEPGYKYGSRTFGGFPYVVPITAKNLDMISAVMEIAACESHKTVIPVLYDTVIKVKNTRDEDAGKMLDLMRGNRLTDLGEVYWWDYIEGKYQNLIGAANINISSETEKLRRRAEAEIKKVIKFFTE